MSSPNQQAFSLDEGTRTVTIHQPDFTLNQTSLLSGYHHRIFATTVRIDEDCVTAGHDLTIASAQIIVGKAGAKVDTSGPAGTDGTSPTSPDAIGVTKGLNGNAGANGANGKDSARSLFPDSAAVFRNACLDENLNAWRLNFSLPLGRDANAYHVRLRDIRAYPAGLGVDAGAGAHPL